MQLIRGRVSVEKLVHMGLQYSQIARLMADAESAHLIEEKAGQLQLTPLGNIRFDELAKKQGLAGAGRWITPPNNERRIPKFHTDHIYVPEMKKKPF